MAKTQTANRVKVTVNGAVVTVNSAVVQDLWEATSFELDELQSNTACAEQNVNNRHKPAWMLTYELRATPVEWLPDASKYLATIIREEGSNSDREKATI